MKNESHATFRIKEERSRGRLIIRIAAVVLAAVAAFLLASAYGRHLKQKSDATDISGDIDLSEISAYLSGNSKHTLYCFGKNDKITETDVDDFSKRPGASEKYDTLAVSVNGSNGRILYGDDSLPGRSRSESLVSELSAILDKAGISGFGSALIFDSALTGSEDINGTAFNYERFLISVAADLSADEIIINIPFGKDTDIEDLSRLLDTLLDTAPGIRRSVELTFDYTAELDDLIISAVEKLFENCRLDYIYLNDVSGDTEPFDDFKEDHLFYFLKYNLGIFIPETTENGPEEGTVDRYCAVFAYYPANDG